MIAPQCDARAELETSEGPGHAVSLGLWIRSPSEGGDEYGVRARGAYESHTMVIGSDGSAGGYPGALMREKVSTAENGHIRDERSDQGRGVSCVHHEASGCVLGGSSWRDVRFVSLRTTPYRLEQTYLFLWIIDDGIRRQRA